MMTLDGINCGNCGFWFGSDGEGECRRFPPQVVVRKIQHTVPKSIYPHFDNKDRLERQWPWTKGSDCCGEHSMLLKERAKCDSSLLPF